MVWKNKARWVHDFLAVAVTRALSGEYILTGLDYVAEDEWIICKAPDETMALLARDVLVEKLKPEEVYRLKDMPCEEILKSGGAK